MSAKPVIFISYSHKDEPDNPRDGEVAWLSFVRTYLQPAVKHGVFELWDDRSLEGGADWDPEIERKLRECDIFILLVSPHSMASNYIVDREIAVIRERQAAGEDVHFYPLLLTPTPRAGLDKVRDKNLRPRDAKPFSGFSPHDRMQHMSDAADEIAVIAARIDDRKSKAAPVLTRTQPAYVHITGLPETPYERLVGRDGELQRLDDAWADPKTAILSLIAEGGAGKSALVNEWLKRMQAGNYRGADAVLGWSFYSQGTKERATSADEFLNWAVEKLQVKPTSNNATAKGEAIAEALMSRRALLVLDGVEPLQFGPEGELGRLKDGGLRMLLRRFAATAPGPAHGLIVLTSRLEVRDIAGRKDAAAPVLDVEKLSGAAGAALLRDNKVWGADRELAQAAHDFGGHPLALGLLASFLKETQNGDVRRRDHMRALLADTKNPGQDQAARVMESYEKEWLTKLPALHAIMFLMGLFDRPADGGCLQALRREPAIQGFTDEIVKLDDIAWSRDVARLRDVRLLLPVDPSDLDAIDAHPLVREWFGARLKAASEEAWKAAHGRLLEHLRDTTKEGDTPTLAQLAPLYQAIMHGCRAGRHKEVLEKLYKDRICRWKVKPQSNLEYYSMNKLGAFGSDLSAISWFFEKPYRKAVATFSKNDRIVLQHLAVTCLRAQGRFVEALQIQNDEVHRLEEEYETSASQKLALRLSRSMADLSRTQGLVGQIVQAGESAAKAVALAKRLRSTEKVRRLMTSVRVRQAELSWDAGRLHESEAIYLDEEQWRSQRRVRYSLVLLGYCDLLLARGDWIGARDKALQALGEALSIAFPVYVGKSMLMVGRAELGSITSFARQSISDDVKHRAAIFTLRLKFDGGLDHLRAGGTVDQIPVGLLVRARLRRSIGDWDGVVRDLDEISEIAEPGSMRVFLCDTALERARLAFAQSEAFVSLNCMTDNSPSKPELPSGEWIAELRTEAAKQIEIAAGLIDECGYHRRDMELAELQSVLRGECTFASLPIHV